MTQQPAPFNKVALGRRFKQWRLELELSRADLAGRCGYGAEQVRRVELGLQAPGARLLAALMDAGADIQDVLSAAKDAQP